jgi:hypothetical protein
MRFSQRIGITPANKLAQRQSMDDELRSSLWSLLTVCYWRTGTDSDGAPLKKGSFVQFSSLSELALRLWFRHYKLPVDTIDEYWGNWLAKLRERFFAAEWFEVYDLVEFVVQNGPEKEGSEFVKLCNHSLEHENSAYRFVGRQLTEITSQAELDSVEQALQQSQPYAGVHRHLESALTLMSDRRSPDYRNSIKESISAVESLAKQLSNDNSATLGAVLKELERTKKLHPALRSAFSSLYGYTSDAQGIRHALLDEPSLTKGDARFMLVCCTSFINYVIASLAPE